MKKKRILYSELAPRPERSSVAEAPTPLASYEPTVATPAPPTEIDVPIVDYTRTMEMSVVAEIAAPVVVPVAPRPRRDSTPVEWARALAAERLREAAERGQGRRGRSGGCRCESPSDSRGAEEDRPRRTSSSSAWAPSDSP